MESNIDVMDEGIRCLSEHLGAVKTEQFIAVIQRERTDYTKWHQRFADSVSEAEFDRLCRESAKAHPYAGAPESVL